MLGDILSIVAAVSSIFCLVYFPIFFYNYWHWRNSVWDRERYADLNNQESARADEEVLERRAEHAVRRFLFFFFVAVGAIFLSASL